MSDPFRYSIPEAWLMDITGADPPSADEAVARLRLQLRHKSVADLVEDGLVEWDRANNVVRKGPTFDRERPLKR